VYIYIYIDTLYFDTPDRLRCVTAELTDFGIRISEVRSLCGVDITGWAALLLTFLGGLACHGRSNQLVGGNVMSLLTDGEKKNCCSW